MYMRNSLATVALLALALSACGGSSSSGTSSGDTTLGPPSTGLVRVSEVSPYDAGCGGEGGTSYEDAEVEPFFAINPNNPSNLIGAWQQDRWDTGGAHGLVAGSSMDGGKTWKEHTLPLSVCAGGTQANGGNYGRASDPWVSFALDGTAYVISISFTGNTLQPGSSGGVLVTRSTDGGATWSHAATLIKDGADAFNDKESITADPTDAHFVYAVWDRLTVGDHGATWSAPSTIAANLAVGAADPHSGQPIRSGSGLPQAAAGPGGMLAVVWEDGRFSNGDHDGIAFASSQDDGAHWTKPVEINSVHGTPAFTPSVAILADGTVGVSYFDFRHDTSGPDLPTDYWFTSSTDGTHWSEQHISGPFDMTLAPDAEGLFIGDYQALGNVGSVFVPFFVQTTDSGTADRTDAFYLPPQPKPLLATRRVSRVALAVATPAPDHVFRQRVHENIMRVLRDEDPVWDAIRAQRQGQRQPP
jgi:hypothetical protein